MRLGSILIILLGLSIVLACTTPSESPVLEGPSVVRIPPPTEYPPFARMARISGELELRGAIDSTGTVLDVVVVSGPALRDLRAHASDWVYKWRFQPVPESSQRHFLVRVRYRLIEKGNQLPPPCAGCLTEIFTPTVDTVDPVGTNPDAE